MKHNISVWWSDSKAAGEVIKVETSHCEQSAVCHELLLSLLLSLSVISLHITTCFRPWFHHSFPNNDHQSADLKADVQLCCCSELNLDFKEACLTWTCSSNPRAEPTWTDRLVKQHLTAWLIFCLQWVTVAAENTLILSTDHHFNEGAAGLSSLRSCRKLEHF